MTITNQSQPALGSTAAPSGVASRPARTQVSGRATLAAAFLGMFVVTLDAVIVNVALTHIQSDLGGGMTGIQWVVDGYTLMFAALLLSAGAISDRVGARRSFGAGLVLFAVASAACGLAPSLPVLVAARLVQGASAALVMPTSMSLIGQAFPDPARRASAVGVWALGGAVASSSGPVLGGLLSTIDWRLIFAVNVPVAVGAVVLLRKAPDSARHDHPTDRAGQLLAVVGLSSLTYAAIEGGSRGLGSDPVIAAIVVALVALPAFVLVQARARHPMVPSTLFSSRSVTGTVLVGAAFMACYYGMPFVLALDLQQGRGMSSLATGVVFLPMVLVGLVLTPFSARAAARVGPRRLMASGLVVMAAGLVGLAAAPADTPIGLLAALMLLVGLGGPSVMPPATATLLGAVPAAQSGTASGVFNTSRQLGGALAVAVFGALLTEPATFHAGVRMSMLIAAFVAMAAAVATRMMLPGSS